MKKTLLCSLILTTACFRTDAQIPGFGFEVLATLSCPFDAAQTITWPAGWTIYQTQDNRWNGPLDSTRCIAADLDPDGLTGIDLDQIDVQKALFIRRPLPDADGILLLPDFLYKLVGLIRIDNALIRTGDDCGGTICSGVISVVEIPDETGSGTTQRIHTSSFIGQTDLVEAQTCLVTEYFDTNTLRELIIKVTFQEASAEGRLGLAGVYAEEPFLGLITPVTELVFPDNTLTEGRYQAEIYEAAVGSGGESPYLFLHERDVYPNAENITYVEARPETPTRTPANLELTVGNWESISFQPFTGIRGALVDPNDTLRHRLTLINEGSVFCFPNIVELIASGDTEIEFRSGSIDFNGPNSCLMLRDGGTLSIADNTRLVFGRGIGLLGLDKGGNIKIGKNSELVINNTALLPNYRLEPDRQFYLELLPGSRLTFGEQSRLIRKGHVEDGQMQLNVYMKGGILDDNRLSEWDRRLINRIYPEKNTDPGDWLRIFGNPTRGRLRFSAASGAADQRLDWIIRDLNGRVINRGNCTAVKGINEYELDVALLADGMYTLEVRRASGSTVRKFAVF